MPFGGIHRSIIRYTQPRNSAAAVWVGLTADDRANQDQRAVGAGGCDSCVVSSAVRSSWQRTGDNLYWAAPTTVGLEWCIPEWGSQDSVRLRSIYHVYIVLEVENVSVGFKNMYVDPCTQTHHTTFLHLLLQKVIMPHIHNIESKFNYSLKGFWYAKLSSLQ